MIPLRDNLPTHRFPVVTVLLIVANVVVFLLDMATGRHELAFVQTERGVFGVDHFVGGLAGNWAMVPAAVSHDPGSAWVTVLTSMFLHANWLHIGGNMLYLWIFGNNVEDTLGVVGFLAFYLVCGVAAAAAHIVSGPGSTIPTVGASGAVAGLMGGYLVLFPRARILSIVPIFGFGALMEVSAIWVIGLWGVLQLVNANMLGGGGMEGGGVAYMAHLGGLVAGLAIIWLLGGRRLAERRRGGADHRRYGF